MSQPPIKIAALAAVIGLVLAAVGPVAAATTAAGNDGLDGAGNQGLSIGVQQGAGSATVAVTANGSSVANATVTVTANTSYNGTGTYSTDAAGTVSLPLPGPNETITAEITATKDGLTGTATVTLRGSAGRGPSFVPPGQRVASFVHSLQQRGIVRIGLFVSSYAHAIVPSGGSMANAGPPSWLHTQHDSGPPGVGGSSDEATDRGPPSFVDQGDNDRRGPPAFVDRGDDDTDRGPPDFIEPDDEDDDQDEDEDDADSDNDGTAHGPEHARGNAHGHDK